MSFVVLYYLLSATMIEYCAYDLTHFQGDTTFFFGSGEETQFLIRMGRRSLPALNGQLARTDLSTRMRTHLAWTCLRIGDSSKFPVLLDSLKSSQENDRYLAVARMADFPEL